MLERDQSHAKITRCDQVSGDQSYRQSLKKTSARIGDPKRACAKIVNFVSQFRDASNSPRRLLRPRAILMDHPKMIVRCVCHL
jgi:hypothetical protein